jgi:hypothetical protein
MIRLCRPAAWMSRPCIWFESPRGYAPWLRPWAICQDWAWWFSRPA